MASTYKAVKASAPGLATLVIEAHGGLERWKRFTTVSVRGINGGVLGAPWAKPECSVTWPLQSTFATRKFRTGPSARQISTSRNEMQVTGTHKCHAQIKI
jgi:hypothetical protein